MSKHVPGPWSISSELSTDHHIVIDTGNKNGGSILLERHIEGHDSSDLPTARLIAAAPEMFEALRRILEDGDCTCSTEERLTAPDGCGFCLARIALSKAEGK